MINRDQPAGTQGRWVKAEFQTRSNNSRSTLGDTTQSLSQVLATTDERHLESVLANVVRVVGHGKDLGFLKSAETQNR